MEGEWRIKIQWCKGHSGIIGNEMADKAATAQLKKMQQIIKKDLEKIEEGQKGVKRKVEGDHGKIIEVEDDIEEDMETSNIQEAHRNNMNFLYNKIGGRKKGMNYLADMIWRIGSALPQMRNPEKKQQIEGAFAARRAGSSMHTEEQVADIHTK